MAVHIREAQPGDEAALVSMIRALGEAVDYPSPITQEFANAYLAQAGGRALLAEEDGRPVGLLSFWLRPDLFHAAPSADIEELVVADTHRGQGVGAALLEELLRLAAEWGCVEVSVSALPDNEGALRFYRAHGLTDEAVLLERHL